MAQGGSHHGSTLSWVAVVLMVLGVVIVGLAMVFTSWLAFWVGVVIGVVGVGFGVAGGLLNDNPALPGEPGYQTRH